MSFIFFVVLGNCFFQKEITWEDLECDIEEVWSDEFNAVYMKPNFDGTQKALNGENVSLYGYIYLIDMMDSIHPYYVCTNKELNLNHCRMGISEEHILMEFISGVLEKELLGKLIHLSGKLMLNEDDILRMIYILENAKTIE